MAPARHNWPDARAFSILEAVRRAAPPKARLLIIERMVPDDPRPHITKTLDVGVLALHGGQQRTRREYTALLERAGFMFEREIETPADVSIKEAITR